MGYTFHGDAPISGLTMPEIRILRAGYEVESQLQQDEMNGVEQSDRSDLARFNQELQDGTWHDNHADELT